MCPVKGQIQMFPVKTPNWNCPVRSNWNASSQKLKKLTEPKNPKRTFKTLSANLKHQTQSAHLKGPSPKCPPKVKTLSAQNPNCPPQRLKPKVPTSNVKIQSAHLKGQNPKYPPQKSQPKLPTSKVKTLSAHLKGQNPKCLPQR